MSNRFLDYFRCPEQYAAFATPGDLSSAPGFFKFRNAVCYGRVRGVLPGQSATVSLPDVREFGYSNNGHIGLPFDISEVVDNLRYERYHYHRPGARQNGPMSLTNSVYYLVRPVLPVAVRKHLQKVRLRGWEQIPFPRWPIDVSVDEVMQSSMALMLQHQGLTRIPFVWFWPEGAPSCGIMTHDVEGPEGRDFCDQLMDMNDAAGIRASFQIIPEKRYDVPDAFLARLRARGFEINVHDLNHDGRLFQSEERFRRRAQRINEYGRKFGSRGFRSGAMYREQQWFDALDFAYDMSVPNVAHLEPQRGGCCTLMPYFIGKIVELPLTAIQDYSLFHIIGDYSIELWKQQIDLIRARHGLISFIVHPDYVKQKRARSVYLQLLDHLRRISAEGKVWMAMPGDVERWWRSRGEMRLLRTGDSWSIEGADSQRARVAYATLRDGHLVYELDAASGPASTQPVQQH